MVLWLRHTARDREWNRERETMGFYITLCTVHTTQEQGQGQVTIVLYCVYPRPYPVPGPVQCEQAISQIRLTSLAFLVRLMTNEPMEFVTAVR